MFDQHLGIKTKVNNTVKFKKCKEIIQIFSFFIFTVIPRFLFDKFTDSDFSKMLTYDNEKNQVIQLILETCKQYLFDGIVLEIWSQLAARVDDKNLIDFVSDIGKKKKILIFISTAS